MCNRVAETVRENSIAIKGERERECDALFENLLRGSFCPQLIAIINVPDNTESREKKN